MLVERLAEEPEAVEEVWRDIVAQGCGVSVPMVEQLFKVTLTLTLTLAMVEQLFKVRARVRWLG